MSWLIYFIGCFISFFAFWGLRYFESYLTAKYYLKTNIVEWNITVVDIVGCIFATVLSILGIFSEFLIFIIMLAMLFVEFISKKIPHPIKTFKFIYKWYKE